MTGIETAGRLEPRENLTLPAPAPPEMPGRARVDALIADALKGRAERRALEQRVSSAEDRAQASRASGRPQVALGAGYDYARPNPRIFPQKRRLEDVMGRVDRCLVVAVGQRPPRGRAGRSARERARAQRAIGDFDRQVTFEVRQRTLQLDSSRAAVTATDDEVRAALEAERVVGERYRVGVATPTDVLDAQVARLQAELDRTRAIANVRLAEAQLQRALGR